jgi:hypothetical protein
MDNVSALPTVRSAGRFVVNRERVAVTTFAWTPGAIRTTVATATGRALNRQCATTTGETAIGTGWNAAMVNVCALLTTRKLNITFVMTGASLEVTCAAKVVQGENTRAPRGLFAVTVIAVCPE